MAFLERNANRGSIPTGPYEIDNSCVFIDTDRSSTGNGANSHLHFTPSSTGNRKVGTFSAWVKRSHIDSIGAMFSSGQNDQHFRFQSTGINIRDYNESTQLHTDGIYRDTAAYYHFVMAVDTTQGTAANRLKLYINGEQITSFSTETYPTQNQDWNFNYTGNKMFIGARRWHNDDVIQGFDGYMADVHWIDGTQKAATDFGKYDDNGVWVAKAYSGAYGTNGCHLTFDNASDLGEDSSGNGNDWTLVNISSSNQATDNPTNNFCTMNELHRINGNIKTHKGGTEVTTDGGSGWCSMLGTMAMSAGKWYWEALVFNNSDALTVYVGIAPHNDPYVPHHQTGYYLGNVETAGSMGWYLNDGSNKNQNGTWGNPGQGDKIMIAYDADNYKLYYGINGTWGNSANPANGTGSVTAISSYWMSALKDPLDFVLPAVTVYQGKYMKGFNFGGYNSWTVASGNADANGYGNFEYAPPTGFYALCTKNLAQYGG